MRTARKQRRTPWTAGAYCTMLAALVLSAVPAAPPRRPYTDDSPWNLPIGRNPVYDRHSEELVASLSGAFGCDPTQYAYTVYDAAAPVPVQLSGVYSDVTDEGTRLAIRKRLAVMAPLPPSAVASSGRDAQIVVVDPASGDEWGFWRFARSPEGVLTARNGYHYNIRWCGVPPIGFNSRGAGVPYLAGLVRPAEIRRARIEHALAFGCVRPSALFVFPATKSDGTGAFPALPEGARLQLDPALTDRDFDEWGLDGTGKTIARALQEYGMVLVDGSGHTKIYVEDDHTARWGDLLHADTVKPIPYSAFRVLSLTAPARPDPPDALRAVGGGDGVLLTWEPSNAATRYRVSQRMNGDDAFTTVDPWVVEPRFLDRGADVGTPQEYSVQAVSYNGVSERATVRFGPAD